MATNSKPDDRWLLHEVEEAANRIDRSVKDPEKRRRFLKLRLIKEILIAGRQE